MDILSATPTEFQSHLDAGLGMEAIAALYGVTPAVIGSLDFFRSAKRKGGFRAPPAQAYGDPIPLTELRGFECAVIVNEELPYLCCGAPSTHRFRFCEKHASTMLNKGVK